MENKIMTLLEFLISLGYSEFEAKGLILSMRVRVNNYYENSLKFKISAKDKIIVKTSKEYVSRGADKLKSVFDKFDIDVENKVIIDVGASTGGFTQYLLTKNPKKIYALDAGTNQLDYSLRIHEKVVSIEKTHFNKIGELDFKNEIEFLIADVSFISLKKLVPIMKNDLVNCNDFLLLFKPQFEAKKEDVSEAGFVEEALHERMINDFIMFANSYGFDIERVIESEVKGKKSGNQEYFIYCKRGSGERY
ncbi:TlyA family RNA methyltransferase [Mycoplasmopsis agassizii]|uniref:TlyA family RNA methyltransferase n=1 Tax=Mycoplasmopsis agassizii TaxID=33922 RepID=A0ABX4H5Z8_9BACT|nr:TlyA family RNA methyltransferase [Mycoplasmopsis agassizii]PAF55277.1 TlyA family RNA methyltransferase [Mycoplasmopsis agassizii]